MSAGLLNVIRCGCYVLAGILTPLAALLAGCADKGEWPVSVAIASALVTGIVNAAINLRAYLDGSNERYQQAKGTGQ